MKFLTLLFLMLTTGSFALNPPDTAAGFTVKDVAGITYRLQDELDAGQMVLLDFFTITCGPCVTYAPEISASYTHFGSNSSNVTFLGINWGADNAGVSNFGTANGVLYPEASGLEGNGNAVNAAYGIVSYPTVMLITPDGLIAEPFIWPPSTVHLDSLISAYGGILASGTAEKGVQSADAEPDRLIVSLYPVPADICIHFRLRRPFRGMAALFTMNGSRLQSDIPLDGETEGSIILNASADGSCLLVLFNPDGTIADRQCFLIRHH
jgi:thiol-disulfide isomerase/thioredoxin